MKITVPTSAIVGENAPVSTKLNGEQIVALINSGYEVFNTFQMSEINTNIQP